MSNVIFYSANVCDSWVDIIQKSICVVTWRQNKLPSEKS